MMKLSQRKAMLYLLVALGRAQGEELLAGGGSDQRSIERWDTPDSFGR